MVAGIFGEQPSVRYHFYGCGTVVRRIDVIQSMCKAVEEKADVIKAYVVKDGALVPFEMTLGALTDDEREIIRKGCLINYYRG